MTPDATFVFDFFGALERRAQTTPDAPALQRISGGGREVYSWRKLVDEARACSAALIRNGVQPGDRVAILMENRPEWGVAFAGIQSAGGIAVPLDTLSPAASLARVVEHAQARFLIVSSQFSEAAGEIRATTPLAEIFTGERSWSSLISPPAPGTLPHVPRTIDDDLAILYTGGTTGKPKGVLLTQRNLYRSITDMLGVFTLSPADRILSILPLFHIMPLLANLLAPLYTGAQVVFLAQIDARQVLKAFAEEEITAFLCVPQFYYQMQRRILDEVAAQPRLKQWLFRCMLRFCSLLREWFGIRLGRHLFQPIHSKFGRHLRAFGIGGAAFHPDAARFFAGLGFQLFQAYGLTECSGLATVTPLDRHGGFTSGRPVAHAEVRIDNPAPDGIGEILIRGENIMRGYWREPDATAAVISDGWLHTGDLGTFSDGALRVTGRAKEVIVLSSGKNIYPEELEEYFQNHCTLIQEVCIAGVESPEGTRLHCLAVPNMNAFRNGDSAFIDHRVRVEIETAARRLPVHKRPSGLHVLNQPLPRTTTRKLQRFKAAELARISVGNNGKCRVAETPSSDLVEREIVTLIRRVHKDSGPIDPSSSLELDIHLDSLERVELMVNLEKAFGLSVTPQQSAALFTVDDLVALVKNSTRHGRNVAEDWGSWHDWKSILLAPLTESETAFVAAYLRRRPVAEFFWYAVASAFRFAAIVLLRLRVERPRDWPSGGFLLCPNHISYLDDVLAPAILPFSIFRRSFSLGASKYFRNPFLAFLGRNLRVIPVDTDKHLVETLRVARACLEKGMVLCAFPEGTRSFDGRLQKLMKGPAVLAEAIGVPIIPVGISGTFEVMPRGAGFGGLHPVGIALGSPLAPGSDVDALNNLLSQQIALEIRKAAALHA